MPSFICHWRTPIDRKPNIAPAYGKAAKSRLSLLVDSIQVQHSATNGDRSAWPWLFASTA